MFTPLLYQLSCPNHSLPGASTYLIDDLGFASLAPPFFLFLIIVVVVVVVVIIIIVIIIIFLLSFPPILVLIPRKNLKNFDHLYICVH
jgi:hypothetical protein